MNALWLLPALLAAAAAGEPAIAPVTPAVPASREEVRYLMGTIATVRAEAPDSPAAQAAVDSAWAAMNRVDAQMSTWRADSDLSRANARAANEPVTVAPAVARVVSAALRMAGDSGGAFDPTVLPLVRAWGLHGGTPREPAAGELAALLAVTDMRLVQVDTVANTIAFTRPGVALDLGGIAKGYALDRARAAMAAAGASAGVLDLGGNLLVFGLGDRDVAIVAPDDPQVTSATVTVRDGAVATSGQYERFVEIDGRRRGHILDPRTGQPVPRMGSATVVASSGLLADALSTAVFVLGPDAGAELVSRFPGAVCVFVVENGDGGWTVFESGSDRPGSERPGSER